MQTRTLSLVLTMPRKPASPTMESMLVSGIPIPHLLFFSSSVFTNKYFNSFRYFVKVTVARSFATNIVTEQDVWVQNYTTPPDIDKPIKMEVGIEDCLHIEFEYVKSKYHLRDVVIGKIYFLLVRLKIKYMEIALQKRESTGSGPNSYSESETITKFEIMDGCPVRGAFGVVYLGWCVCVVFFLKRKFFFPGESIPVRLFLGAFDLTPTYKNVHNKFSVKFYLNLVLVDEEDRRYFKQQEYDWDKIWPLDQHK